MMHGIGFGLYYDFDKKSVYYSEKYTILISQFELD